MSVSASSDSLKPSAAKILMPLSWYGLWDAEMTAARSSPWRLTSSGAAGGAQVRGGEGDQLVTVDDRAVAVDREHAVAVAVEREADVMAARADVRLQGVEMGGPDAVVDVAPVGLRGDDVDGRPESPERLRRRLVGRAVGAVQRHPAPREVQPGEALLERAQVVLKRPVQPAHAADARRGDGRLPHSRLDVCLVGVGQLEAVGAEDLDAVVVVRVVRRRDDGGQVEPVPLDQQRRRRRGQHAGQEGLATGRRDARREGRFQHLAGLARVPEHQDPPAAAGLDRLGRRRAGE